MSTLFDRTIAESYKELLKTASTDGVNSSLTIVEDGDATASALQISTTTVKSSGSLEVVGPATLTSTLSVTGASTLTGNVSMGGDLTVAGNAVIQGTLTANGGTLTLGDADTDNVVFNADINSHILPNTDNTYDLGSAAKSWRNLHIDGTATLNNLSITGSQTVSATTQSTDKDTGALVIEGGVGVEKNANIGGTLGVIGSTTLSNTLGVSGATTLSSTLGVSDTISATKATGTGLAVTSNATVGGTLGVTGASTLTGNASVGGTLGVTGDVAVNTNKFNVTAASGNTSVAGTLGVTNATTLSSTLGVTGDTTLTGNLTANANTTLGDANTDTVTFNARAASNFVPATDDTHDLGSSTLEWKDLYVDGTAKVDTLTVDENATVAGNLTVTGDLTINGATTNINTTNLVVEDKNVILGDVATPTNTTADGGGITLKGTTDKTLNWVNATNAWTSSEDFNLVSGKVYEINGTSVLSATSLGSGVTGSSLTSVGTIGTGTWQGTIVGPTYGGTGVNNAGKTVTLGGSLTTSGAHTTTLTTTGNTSVTLPTTGTLATLAGTETLTNKSINLANNTLTATSSQIASAVTDETGSGNLVFANSPTLTTPNISSIVNTGTLSLPTSTDTLVGRATTDTLTNKTINLSSNTLQATSAELATAISDETGTGSLVFANSPTLVTPTLGAASATSLSLGTPLSPANGGTGLSTTSAAAAGKILGVAPNGSAHEYKTLTPGTGISITDSAGIVTITNTGSGSGGGGGGSASGAVAIYVQPRPRRAHPARFRT